MSMLKLPLEKENSLCEKIAVELGELEFLTSDRSLTVLIVSF